MFKIAPRIGLEPITYRLTADRSTIELPRITYILYYNLKTFASIFYFSDGKNLFLKHQKDISKNNLTSLNKLYKIFLKGGVMADYKDYYKILGVNKNATDAEIKKAFKTQARKYHPDMHPESKKAEMTEKFKDINEAYEVLSDKQKRTIYDQVGSGNYQNYARGGGASAGGAGNYYQNPGGGQYYQYTNTGGANPFGNGGFNFNGTGGFQASDFSDFFQSIFGGLGGLGGFGGGRTSRRRTSTQDPYGIYSNTPEEANLSLDLASAYQGGMVRLTLPSGKSAQVKFPPRIAQGAKIKLKGLGSNGGDLYVNIQIATKEPYTLEGEDIYYTLNIMPWTAALGGTASVYLPDSSSVNIKIPAGSKSEQKLKLSGRGLGKSGNFYVKLLINNPEHLTSRQKELYKELAK